MSHNKFKNTLLFLTRTFDELNKSTSHLIEQSFRLTQSNLFIYIAPKLPPLVQITKSSPQMRFLANEFYSSSSRLNPAINVVCLLNTLANHPHTKYGLDYDIVLTDSRLDDPRMEAPIRDHLKSKFRESNVELRSIETGLDSFIEPSRTIDFKRGENDLIAAEKTYRNSILGGTFDRIHMGHKLLLTESLLLTTDRLLVGLAEGPLLVKKKLADLIEDASVREHNLRELVGQMRPDIELIVTPIQDPYGPSITEPDYQCLIASEETKSGGEAVNVKRLERGLSKLDLHVISLAKEDVIDQGDEDKVSSSNERRRLLGKLLKQARNPPAPNKPYVIGLTGGLASGKSAILNDLSRLGAGVIDCDKLGHMVYLKGTSGYAKLVDTFGTGILNADGEIDRKELGKLVFVAGDQGAGLKRLTDIVWPQVHRMVEEKTRELYEKGHQIVVVEAPLLIEAGWLDSMNEIWVVFVPYEEALQRAMKRDGSDETKVRGTLNSQLPNKERIKHANVVFSSLWEREYTIKQVVRAWDSLLQRIKTN